MHSCVTTDNAKKDVLSGVVSSLLNVQTTYRLFLWDIDAATLRYKLRIRLAILPSHIIPPLCQPVPTHPITPGAWEGSHQRASFVGFFFLFFFFGGGGPWYDSARRTGVLLLLLLLLLLCSPAISLESTILGEIFFAYVTVS